MKTLDALIKLHQQSLDQEQVKLKLLMDRLDLLHSEISAMEQEIIREEHAILMEEDNPEKRRSYGQYRLRIERNLVYKRGEVEKQTERVRVQQDIMIDIFSEAKKIEITRDQREISERRAIDKKHDTERDELMIQRFNKS